MGWTVLHIAFGVVALWLLGEVLLQYKARLRWRLPGLRRLPRRRGGRADALRDRHRAGRDRLRGRPDLRHAVVPPRLRVRLGGQAARPRDRRRQQAPPRPGGPVRAATAGVRPPTSPPPAEAGDQGAYGPGRAQGDYDDDYDRDDVFTPAAARTAEPAAAGTTAVYEPQPLPEDTGNYGVYGDTAHATAAQQSHAYDYSGYGQQGYGYDGTGQQGYANYSDPYIGTQPYGSYDQPYAQQYGQQQGYAQDPCHPRRLRRDPGRRCGCRSSAPTRPTAANSRRSSRIRTPRAGSSRSPGSGTTSSTASESPRAAELRPLHDQPGHQRARHPGVRKARRRDGTSRPRRTDPVPPLCWRGAAHPPPRPARAAAPRLPWPPSPARCPAGCGPPATAPARAAPARRARRRPPGRSAKVSAAPGAAQSYSVADGTVAVSTRDSWSASGRRGRVVRPVHDDLRQIGQHPVPEQVQIPLGVGRVHHRAVRGAGLRAPRAAPGTPPRGGCRSSGAGARPARRTAPGPRSGRPAATAPSRRAKSASAAVPSASSTPAARPSFSSTRTTSAPKTNSTRRSAHRSYTARASSRMPPRTSPGAEGVLHVRQHGRARRSEAGIDAVRERVPSRAGPAGGRAAPACRSRGAWSRDGCAAAACTRCPDSGSLSASTCQLGQAAPPAGAGGYGPRHPGPAPGTRPSARRRPRPVPRSRAATTPARRRSAGPPPCRPRRRAAPTGRPGPARRTPPAASCRS